MQAQRTMTTTHRRRRGRSQTARLQAATQPRSCIESLEQRYLLASITWANAAGQTNWNSGASWVGGVVPGTADTAVFASAATVVQPTLTANANVAGITINNSGADYNIGGSGVTLTLGGGGIGVTSPTSTAASTSTVSSNIVLSAGSYFNSTNNTGVNTLTIAGTVNTAGFAINKNNTGTTNFNGAISGSGILNIFSGITNLGAANSYTGSTQVSGGTVNANAASAISAGTIWLWGGNLNATATNSLTGTATLQVANVASTATLSAASNRTGTTTLTSGVLQLSHGGANASAGLILNGGTLRLRSNTSATFTTASTQVAVSGSNVTTTIDVDRVSSGTNQTLSLGAVTMNYDNTVLNVTGANGFKLGLGAVTMQYGSTKNKTINATTASVAVASATGSGQNLTLGGSASANTVGAITTGAGTVTYNGGTWTATGTHTYTGATAVSAGRVHVNGTTASGSAVTVGSGDILGGTGTIGGAVTVQSGGTFAPGELSTTAILNTGNLSLASGATYSIQINTSTAGTGYDRANVTGTVNLTGATLTATGTRTASPGTQITIITNDGSDAVTGTFSGLAEGATVTVNGVNYTISYVGGTGNDVVLTDVASGPLNNLSPFGVAPSNSSINIVVSGTVTTRFDSWAPLLDTHDIEWVRTYQNVYSSAAGVYDYAKWDHTLAVAAANNIEISSGFTSAPSYITSTGGFPVGATQLALWYTYVNDIVTHTAGQVKHWEVWNEPPNFTNGLGTPTDYAALVQTTYDAIKAADPTAQVGLTAVSTAITWLKQSIQAGAVGHFDYITVHPYETFDTLDSGHEAQYMSVVPTIRKMLADVAPTQVNVPVWFTEIGRPIYGTVDANKQGEAVVKAFTIGLAQGAARVHWFEPLDGDSGAFGLFTNSYVIRQSGRALSTMVDYFGSNPDYLGWVQLNGDTFGFVFQGASGTVMATWAKPGVTSTVNFGSTVTIVTPNTGGTSTASSYALTNTPILVSGVPASIVSQATANAGQPFLWDGDHTSATSVNVNYTTNPATETGLHPLGDTGSYTSTPAYGQTVAYAGGGAVKEAEAGTLSGAVTATTNTGYTGSGYADFTSVSGGYVQWNNVYQAAAGSQTFRIHYANGDSVNRPLSLSVNGTVINSALTFNPTGGWTNWRIVDIAVNLVAGNNTIRLTTTGTDGSNIDNLMVAASTQNFTVDPNFLSYAHGPITITAEVRRDEANNNAGFNLWYESTTGFKAIGWNGVNTNASWQTLTWNISDAEFVGRWGKHFWFASDAPANSRYYIRNVTVTKNGAFLMSLPASTTAMGATMNEPIAPVVQPDPTQPKSQSRQRRDRLFGDGGENAPNFIAGSLAMSGNDSHRTSSRFGAFAKSASISLGDDEHNDEADEFSDGIVDLLSTIRNHRLDGKWPFAR